MKEVKLIRFDTQEIMVDDLRNCIDMRTLDKPFNEIVGSHEYIPHFVDVENIRIERIVDHGVEHYIAVSERIWEYLYLIENPVTGKTQQARIDALKAYKSNAMVTIEIKVNQYKRITTASLWTRIKWVFTGVK